MSADLQHEVEQFFYHEAELLDDGRFREWLDLVAEEIEYTVGTKPTVDPFSPDAVPPSLAFEDNKESLTWRVKRSETGMAWAEEPPSRTRYLITNVRITPDAAGLFVRSNFMFYRNRLETTAHFLVGSREDNLQRGPDGRLLIARRAVTLDQNVILSNNLSMFF
ncbi:3-phenylpropionate/cinnamic acid dioxygenase subunit beta [Pseudonocardia bannensis]|uniref:3-phenylpropionate/cinnamic acid dioxygenase subunit beta n=1 Tax=Pseudonocardia bannensis TaxID=630973 RepID=A0A848DJM7_9PSEU|nr:3-phenylpropionate/cinnamic acid dioxygenase subunit beta [Pseudonocardia bannensis]